MQKIKNNYVNGRYTMLTTLFFYGSLLKAIVKNVVKRNFNANGGPIVNIDKRSKPLDALFLYNIIYFWWLEAELQMFIVVAGF